MKEREEIINFIYASLENVYQVFKAFKENDPEQKCFKFGIGEYEAEVRVLQVESEPDAL